MPIYRGPGGSGDAVNDASSEATLVAQLVVEAQEDADAAQASATAAAGSASAASSSASAASTSASNAATSATNASNSASTATTQATNAANSATAAQTAETAAELAETNAETAQAAAASSASAAATSATNSANSASAASTSATNASNSASSASTSATNASNSATAAATSASNASTSATAAAASAVTAAGYVVPSQTGNNGKYLKTDGTATSWDALDISTADITGTLPLANGGTGGTTAATARTSLGLAIGTNVQAWDADLDTWATKTAPSGTVVGTSDTQTLTNKTIALGSNTVSGTLAQFNTAVTDADLVSLAGTETLTNKTLTSPTLTTPALGTPASGVVTNLTGTASININGTVGATTANTGAFTSLTDSGNLTFTGTGNRIIGDFSNATVASRVYFQTSTANSQTTVGIIPNGTNTSSALSLEGDSTLTNGTTLQLLNNFGALGTDSRIVSGIRGTGTYLPLTMYTGGSEKLRIDTSGNVGIGTSSPTNFGSNFRLLDVEGTDYGVIQASNSGTSTTIELMAAPSIGYLGTRSNHPLALRTNDTERMRIDSSGNVGIGNTPAGKLDIGGTSSSFTDVIIRASTAGTSELRFADTTINAGYIAYDHPTDSIRVGLATTEKMRIDSSGNVGIGTSSPAVKLDVTGSIRASQSVTIGTGGTYEAGSIYSDANWGMIFRAKQASPSQADFMWANSAGTERMRITSAGLVGIGTSSPSGRLDVVNTTTPYLNITATASSTAAVLCLNATSGGLEAITYQQGLRFGTATGVNAAGFTERMRITSIGNVFVGKTSIAFGTAGVEIYPTGEIDLTASGQATLFLNRLTSDGNIVNFHRTGTQVGSISVTTTATAYNTSSDYRLKENIAPMTGALNVVQQLKPVTYDWKAGGSSQGFIAHELQAVVPDCVTGEKDAVDAEGNPIYQGIDTSFLVATLTAAIQELKAEFDAYKATHP